jgi:uncharacterized protein (TIGR00661 family)
LKNLLIFPKKQKNLESEPIFPADAKKILICPLNWGLGHASRLIPVIRELLNSRFRVYIGAAGYSLELLKQEFPEQAYINFPSFTVTYGRRKSLSLQLFLQLPKIIYGIVKEHAALNKLVKRYSIDLVISDNRFGLWSKKIPAVYITHQVNVILPRCMGLFEPLIHRLHRYIISKYSECWVPDFEDPLDNLSGKLSHAPGQPSNIKFIGPLSRFSSYSVKSPVNKRYSYDIAIILSGPEPQRTIIEACLIDEIRKSQYKTLIVRGRPDKKQITETSANITLVSHMQEGEFVNMISRSRYIICRSGYSTIMDLIALNRTAVMIPTPGQTEQEYLARHLSGYFCCAEQDNFNLARAIEEIKKYRGTDFNMKDSALKKQIKNLPYLKKQAEKRDNKKSKRKS